MEVIIRSLIQETFNYQTMNLKCRHCGEYFRPSDDTMYLIAEGYIKSSSVDICDDCWDMLQPSEYDCSETFSDADTGL